MTSMAPTLTTGKHVLWWMIGFFAVIIAVNMTLVVLALTTFNGVSEDNAYTDGLAYNQALAAIQDQKGLGWTVDTTIDRPGDRTVSIEATYVDDSKMAINGLTVTAEFVRPVHEGFDFAVPMRATGSGIYTLKTDVPLTGQWMVRLVAQHGDSTRYILTYRTIVR